MIHLLPILLLFLLVVPAATAQAESTMLPFLTGVATGAANGIAEGYANDFANALGDGDSDAATYALSHSHNWRLVMRSGIVLSVGTAMLAPPDGWPNAASRLALYTSSLIVAHHIGHSVQQGQSLTYAVGCYDCQLGGTTSATGGAILGAAIGTVAAAAYITTCEDINTSCLATSGAALFMVGAASWLIVAGL